MFIWIPMKMSMPRIPFLFRHDIKNSHSWNFAKRRWIRGFREYGYTSFPAASIQGKNSFLKGGYDGYTAVIFRQSLWFLIISYLMFSSAVLWLLGSNDGGKFAFGPRSWRWWDLMSGSCISQGVTSKDPARDSRIPVYQFPNAGRLPSNFPTRSLSWPSTNGHVFRPPAFSNGWRPRGLRLSPVIRIVIK